MSDANAPVPGSRVCVVGVGYVGLPLAIALSAAGFQVTGYDTNRRRVEELALGRPGVETVTPSRLRRALRAGTFVPTSDPADLSGSQAIVIAVPTPIHPDGTPDTAALESAARLTVEEAAPGTLVVVESTSYPGTARTFLLPGLSRRLGQAGQDFYLASVPERIDPGNRRYRLTTTPRLIGGVTPACGERARSLYEHVVHRCQVVASPEVAEMAKLLENAFRNVNIALVSELAILCERTGVDVFEVIRAAATKPFGFMPFIPGIGVGGECIPVDPAYLTWYARRKGLPMRTLESAIETNEAMPFHAVERIEAALAADGEELAGASILVLGVSYKPDVADLRNSPALRVLVELHRRGAAVSYHDPLVPSLTLDDIALTSTELTRTALADASLCVVLTRHSRLDLARVRASTRRYLSLAPVLGP